MSNASQCTVDGPFWRAVFFCFCARLLGELAACVRCGAPRGSARHLFAECPHLRQHRCDIESQWQTPSSFRGIAPRITSKGGWITSSVHSCSGMRARMQVAACLLGMDKEVL